MEETKPEIQEIIRNPNGTFSPGVSGNPAGRPKGQTLKEFAREYYLMKTPEEKMLYIDRVEEKRPGFAWEMAEGKAPQQTDITTAGESLVPVLVKFLDGENNRDTQRV